MIDATVLDEDVHERWVYLSYDDEGRAILLARDEWEVLHRPAPDEQG